MRDQNNAQSVEETKNIQDFISVVLVSYNYLRDK